MTILDTVRSTRLTNLQYELEARNLAALDNFWQEISEQGTPLVEPIANDNTNVLVTFLWRAKGETSNVRVLNDDIIPKNPNESAMTQMLDTNLWYKSYCLRHDLRFEYLLSPNDPELLGSQPETWQERTATWQVDPLNPKQYHIVDDGEHPEWEELWAQISTWVLRTHSLVELPAAPPQPRIMRRPDIPAGRVEKHRLNSTVLGNSRVTYVYSPPGYPYSSKPYALLVLLDAWLYHTIIPTPVILDNLLAEGAIPPLVAVLVDIPNLQGRMEELTKFPEYMDFLKEELLPWVHQHYQVTTDPAQTIIAGASASGFTAAVAALRLPEIFGNVLSQSGMFFWKPDDDTEHEWVARQYASVPLLPLHFYMDVGTFEAWDGKEPNMLFSNRHLRTVLQAKGYPIDYHEFQGGHQPIVWQGTLADGLVLLLRDKS